MKKRKFFSLFAILFVAVFALSCCFFFACGSNDDSTEPEDTGTTQDPGTTEDPGSTENPGTTEEPGSTENPGTNPGTTEIDSRIVLKEGSVEGNNDATVTFANPDAATLYIADTSADNDGNVTYTLAGTASTMSEAQANDFWAGHAAEGDAYVIITVSFEEDETVSWTASNGETRERTVDDYEDGEMDVIIRISGNDLSTEIASGTTTYTITDSEGGAVTHTVDFSAVVTEVEGESAYEGSTEYNFSEIDFTGIKVNESGDNVGKFTDGGPYHLINGAFVSGDTAVSGTDYILSYYAKDGDSVTTDTTGLPTELSYTTGVQMNGQTASSTSRVFTLDLSGIDTDTQSVTIQIIGTCDARKTTSSKQSQIVLSQGYTSKSDLCDTSKALAYSTAITEDESSLADGEETKSTNQYAFRTVEYVAGSGTDTTTSLYYIACTQTVRIYAINVVVTDAE